MPLILTFVATTWLLAMIPGVGQALMLRQTLEQGRSAALATTAGTTAGLVAWSVAAAGGLSAVLLANDVAYTVLRCTGGAFLAYMGVQSLRATPRTTSTPARGERVMPRGGRAFLAGLGTNLGNPKAGIFAISLLPQFAPSTGPVFASTVGLGVIWALVTAAWYVVFISLVHRCHEFVTGPSAERRIRRVTGVVLLGLGTTVILGI